MIASFEFARRFVVISSLVVLSLMAAIAAAAPTGGFVAVLNEQNLNGDSMRSVTFFDADAANLPLFSVFVGYEIPGNLEDPTAITVNPVNGDVYVLSFDSGNVGVPRFGWRYSRRLRHHTNSVCNDLRPLGCQFRG